MSSETDRLPAEVAIRDVDGGHELVITTGTYRDRCSAVIRLTADELVQAENTICKHNATANHAARGHDGSLDSYVKVAMRAEVDGQDRTDNLITVVSAALCYATENFAQFTKFAAKMCEAPPAQDDLAAWFRSMQPKHLAILAEAVVDATVPAEMS